MTLHPLALGILVRLAVAADPAPDPIDITPVKDKLVVVDDGHGHYLAVIPFGDSVWDHLYWSPDGKDFWQQRVSGGGSSGTESFDRVFWEPRVRERWRGSLGMKEGVYTVQCADRATPLKPLEAATAKAMLDTARFHPPRWKYRAYALARDDSGTYYYVDRRREEGSMEFRLYTGQRGAMKPLKMTNLVSDSEGDIFVTQAGKLRFIVGKKETLWIAGKRETKLTVLPIEDNAVLIYTDLGVYAGQALGTPCDDL